MQFGQLKRREFIALVGGAAAWPLVARAQRPDQFDGSAFWCRHLRATGRNGRVLGVPRRASEARVGRGPQHPIDYRWGALDAVSSQRFAKELAALQPDVILTSNTPTTVAMLQETRIVPIIFVNVTDPIGSGLATSFPRPGRNVTGFTNIESTMVGKWLELLKEIAPHLARVGILFNPATATYAENFVGPFKTAAVSFAAEAIAARVRDTSDLELVLASLAREPNSGLIAMPDPFLNVHRAVVTSLAARYRLPAIYWIRAFTERGGLLSYGNDVLDNYRRAAAYADRILKGAKPSRPSHPGSSQVRAGHQPQDGQGARPRRATVAARPRRRGDRMSTRREFITLLGGAAAIWPVAARAQQSGQRLRRIGTRVANPRIRRPP